jgi:hypothetical protein
MPVGWTFAVVALLGSVYIQLPWPFVDLYNSFYKATTLTWAETFSHAFGAGVEYRPLMIIGVKLSHQLVGLRAWCYQGLVLLQFASVLLTLIWIFKPVTLARAVAACIALTCVVGLHTSRVLFMFMPLNVHSMGVVILVAVIGLALSSPARLRGWWVLPLTLIALLMLESGVLIVAVTLVLWMAGAPGAGRRAALGTLIALAIYCGIRLGFGAQEAPAVYADTGVGFADIEAARLNDIFRHAPWMLWVYNVVASLLTVIASEPRAGRFLFVEALLNGRVPIWMYVHVATSLLTTAVIGWALVRGRISDARDRFIAISGATLVVAGSAIGFLYTRDRIALSAGIGYAMLLYVAVVALWERSGRPRPRLRVALAHACVAVIAVGWSIRTVETYVQLRDTAWENYREWTERYNELGGFTRPQTDLLMTLRRDAVSDVPRDPRRDPHWTYKIFQRRFDPVEPDPAR